MIGAREHRKTHTRLPRTALKDAPGRTGKTAEIHPQENGARRQPRCPVSFKKTVNVRSASANAAKRREDAYFLPRTFAGARRRGLL